MQTTTEGATRVRARLSRRDGRILALALRKLGQSCDFDQAVCALREAVEELIPAGRIYLLGEREGGPVVGSIVSGVGIVESPRGILVVRGDRVLGRLQP